MYINYYNVGSAWLPHHLNNPSAAPENEDIGILQKLASFSVPSFHAYGHSAQCQVCVVYMLHVMY